MADDKNKRDNRDRPSVAAGEDYGTRYLAERASTITDKVRELIKHHGNDRDTSTKDARKRE